MASSPPLPLSRQRQAPRSRERCASVAHKITLIPGDGIGPEVTGAAVRILEATGVKFEWEPFAAGADAYEKYHEYIPKSLLDSIERTRRRAQRAAHDPDRRRLFQYQRPTQKTIRAVFQLSPD